MRGWYFCLAVTGLVSAGVASGAPRLALTPSGDLAGKGSGRDINRAVSQALTAAHLRLATPAELKRAAKTAQVNLRGRISPEQAARLATSAGCTAAVTFRKASSGAFAQLVDPHGQVALERLLRVKRAKASDADAVTFAAAVVEALAPPASRPAEAAPESAAGSSAKAPAPSLAPPPPPPPPPPPESAETIAALAGPEAPPPPTREPAAGYYFRIGLLGGGAERRFFAPNFNYVSSYPYAAGGATLEVFPFRTFGLGLVGGFAIGRATDQVVGGNGTFLTSDLRVDGAVAYRWRLFSGPYATFLVPRVGFGLRNFDAPHSSGITSTDRWFMVAGLTVTQPLAGRYLRVSGGVAALPFSKLSGAGQTAYGKMSSTGLEWTVELGGDVVAGLEWALQVDQERFFDSYAGPPSTSGIDIYTDYTLQLRYRF